MEPSSSFGFLSLLPPLMAIFLALLTRQIHLSLFAGIYFGVWVLVGWNPFRALGETGNVLVEVFQSRSNTMVIFFCLLVGGLIALIQRSGGVEGFVLWVERRRFVQSRGGAQLLAWLVGLIIFVESSITCLVVGAVSRPLFDRLKISREKLAYICDATSAPVCMLIPLNGWGAMVIGLLTVQNVANPVSTLLTSLPLMFYSILAVLWVPVVILWRDFGPMARAERRAIVEGKLLADEARPMVSEEIVSLSRKEGVNPSALYLSFPIVVMVAFIPVGLYITGNGNPLNGNGSTAVFWGVSLAILASAVLLLIRKLFTVDELAGLVLKGSSGLLPVTILVLLAFGLGIVSERLSAGPYVAGLIAGRLSSSLLPCLVFVAGALISFSTGSSWGTFAVLIPIAIPAASSLGLPLPLALGAVLSGGVFGDHASPLSDTSIISSLSAASDHVDHINTQLPYALIGALISAIFYLLLGWIGSG